jgi:hypothetical protein
MVRFFIPLEKWNASSSATVGRPENDTDQLVKRRFCMANEAIDQNQCRHQYDS